MVADSELAWAVRRQLGLGRLLPLGEASDGSWLAERAARGVLREAAARVPGLWLKGVRLGPAEPEAAAEPAVPAPPSALPPGPLRVDADVAVTPDRPLPLTAETLRTTLHRAADAELGLVVSAVDVHITGLLDEPDRQDEQGGAADAPGTEEGPGIGAREETGPAAAAARAAAGTPGVARLAPVLGHPSRAVRVTELDGVDAGAPGGLHVQVEIAVTAGHRALDVARAVRAAAASAVTDSTGTPGPVTVAVVVTGIEVPRRQPEPRVA